MTAAGNNPQPSFQHRVIIVAVVVALMIIAWYAIDVLLLIFGGLLLAVLLDGLRSLVARVTGLGPGLALAAVLLVLATLVGLCFWFMAAEIAGQFDALSQQLTVAYEDLRKNLSQYEWGRQLFNGNSEEGQTQFNFFAHARTVLSTGLGAVTNLVIILVLGIYLAASPEVYRVGLLHMLPKRRRPRAGEVLDAIGVTLRWWLIGRIITMTIVGVATTVGLMIMGIPMALALGLLAFVLSFVPYIGPILAVIPAFAVALTQSPMDGLYVAGLYLGVQVIESYFIAPFISQRATDVPPALILAAQTVIGVLLGTLGVLFATPLLVATVVATKMLYVQDVLGDDIEVKGDHEPAGA